MQLDIAILIIIAAFTILGFKNGFVHTVFFAFGWIISIAVAFFMRDRVKGFLMENTGVYGWYHARVYSICEKFVSGYTNKLTEGVTDATGGAVGAMPGGLPEGIQDAVTDAASRGALDSVLGSVGGAVGSIGDKLTQAAADQIASASFGVFCFIGTLLAVKLLLFLITLIFSRKFHGGFVGTVDAIGGMLLGLLQGFIVVFVILVLILPVSLAINPGLFETASGMLNTSFFSKTLFTVNPLIPLIDGFAPGLFERGVLFVSDYTSP
jgi:uncharacterized membrane protein required for colicin V production